jgi:hypothetical protein
VVLENGVESVNIVSMASEKQIHGNKKGQYYSESECCAEWFYDSGALVHIMPNKKFLT